MNLGDPRISTCRHCKHYQIEGRRGGYCHQLNSPVQGSWNACTLAIPSFAPLVAPAIVVESVIAEASIAEAMKIEVMQVEAIKVESTVGASTESPLESRSFSQPLHVLDDSWIATQIELQHHGDVA